MWLDTPTPNDLRGSHPDLALMMETDFLAYSLNRLGIQFIRRSRKKTAILEIAMHDSYLLRLQPVDKGSEGYGEWITWSWRQPDCHDGTPTLEMSIRAFVEFVDLSNEDEPTTSFTTHCDDMRELIQNSIGGMRHLTGKRLKPVVVARRKAA